jgi:hypothetical protein
MENRNKVAYTKELAKWNGLLESGTNEFGMKADKDDVHYYKTNIKNLEYRLKNMRD